MNKLNISANSPAAIIFLFSAILLYGCGRPVKDYGYISMNPVRGWEKGRDLTFSLEMEDTVNIYSIYFTSRIKNNRSINDINGFPVNVIFRSPDGQYYSDTISLPLNIIQKRKLYRMTNGIMEIEWPYLKNIRNDRSGTWHITIRQTTKTDIYKNIIGFGVCSKENNRL